MCRQRDVLLYEQISSTEVDTHNGRGVSDDLQYLDKGIQHLSYVSFLSFMGGHVMNSHCRCRRAR